jgi:hypothetical protein
MPECGLLCFSIGTGGVVQFEYEDFLGKVIAFKNNDGFAKNPGSPPSANHRPSLEEIYLLICQCGGGGVEGFVRSPDEPPYFRRGNQFNNRSGQLTVNLLRGPAEEECDYCVSVGAVQSEVKSNPGLRQAVIKIYAREGFVLLRE